MRLLVEDWIVSIIKKFKKYSKNIENFLTQLYYVT